MKALILPTQSNMVVQVVSDLATFDVALPLFWDTCPAWVVAYEAILVDSGVYEAIIL